MTTVTHLEQPTINETYDDAAGYLDLVEQLLDIDSTEVIEARDALAKEMAADPEHYLPRQCEELGMLYRGRTDQQRYDWSQRTEEVSMFASRTPDCSHVEEQYAIIDTFGPQFRHWQHRTYAVKVIRHESPSYLVTHDGQGSVEVRVWDKASDVWSKAETSQRQTMLTDFFYESLRATAMQLARSPEAREAADKDAKEKLETFLYGGKKVVTAVE